MRFVAPNRFLVETWRFDHINSGYIFPNVHAKVRRQKAIRRAKKHNLHFGGSLRQRKLSIGWTDSREVSTDVRTTECRTFPHFTYSVTLGWHGYRLNPHTIPIPRSSNHLQPTHSTVSMTTLPLSLSGCNICLVRPIFIHRFEIYRTLELEYRRQASGRILATRENHFISAYYIMCSWRKKMLRSGYQDDGTLKGHNVGT